MPEKESWDNCMFGSSRGWSIEMGGRKLHQVYGCVNTRIANLGVYPVDDAKLYSKEEGFIVDKTAIFIDADPNMMSIENLIKNVDRALAGCTHCKFYENK